MSVAALRRAAYADQTATGPAYLGHDTFTRADGALGTAETGGPWTAVAGTWTVLGNQARAGGGTGDYDVATLNVGTAAVDLRATVDPANGETNDMGPVARVVDSTHYIILDLTYQAPVWLCRIFQRLGGAFIGLTALVNPIAQLGGDNNTPFRVRLVVGGSYGLDGGEGFIAAPADLNTWISVGSWSNADVQFRTATAHGIAAKETPGSRWDNVEIFAAP